MNMTITEQTASHLAVAYRKFKLHVIQCQAAVFFKNAGACKQFVLQLRLQ